MWWMTPGGSPAFVHGAGEPFPVWWTTLPRRQPVLTGWVGGPPALALSGLPDQVVVERAVGSLASIFGESAVRVRSGLLGWHSHDWESDPYALGAYSYAGVGGLSARDRLTTPVDETLFLGGEALATGGQSATVHGALRDGRRVASRILAGRQHD
jgi:monoamine oxidase